jgi:hypothetical protein
MRIVFLTFILSLFIQLNLSAQVKIKNEIISALGNTVSQDLLEFRIQQAVGQSSVIGNFYNGKLKINQGFLQGFLMSHKNLSESMVVLPFPNPFKDRITFRFSPNIPKDLVLTIYDLFGHILFTKQLTAVNNELLVDLNHLSKGLYLVLFRSGNQVYQTRIIKGL